MHKEVIKIDFDIKTISAVFLAIEFKEAEQFVVHLPSIEISGYGDSINEAKNMVDEAVSTFFENLMALDKNEITKELNRMGFKNSQYFKKRFERSYVDSDGDLQNFDIPADASVSHELLLF
ncbi:MAG: hypothetical protein ABIV51_14650 [Saprospiraceae bacterium]